MKRVLPWAIVIGLILLWSTTGEVEAFEHPGCRPVSAELQQRNPEWYPTGVMGCIVYGDGIASHWPGPGVARNDCLWPWDDCTPIRITSHETGLSIIVTPTMFGDLYSTTSRERIVDLDPAAVEALGLEWSQGLYPVHVEPYRAIPDTATGCPTGAATVEVEDGFTTKAAVVKLGLREVDVAINGDQVVFDDEGGNPLRVRFCVESSDGVTGKLVGAGLIVEGQIIRVTIYAIVPPPVVEPSPPPLPDTAMR